VQELAVGLQDIVPITPGADGRLDVPRQQLHFGIPLATGI
jgi:hypothetical protein